MKKIDKFALALVAILCAIFLISFGIKVHKNNKENVAPNTEVYILDKDLISKYKWEECFFDIQCIDSLQEAKGYYWGIYDNPDQFENTLCVSMDSSTYNTLLDMKEKLSNYTIDSIEYENCIENNPFRLYYCNGEPVILTMTSLK